MPGAGRGGHNMGLRVERAELNPDSDARHSFCDLGAPQLAFLGLSIPI